MMSQSSLESAVSKILDSKSQPSQQYLPQLAGIPQFNQALNPGMEFNAMGLSNITKVEGGNLIVMAIGAALSSTVGGLFGKFFPLGSLSPIVAGVILRVVFKSGNGRDFATGVLLGGASVLIGGLTGGLVSGLGGLFGTTATSTSTSASPALAGVQF